VPAGNNVSAYQLTLTAAPVTAEAWSTPLTATEMGYQYTSGTQGLLTHHHHYYLYGLPDPGANIAEVELSVQASGTATCSSGSACIAGLQLSMHVLQQASTATTVNICNSQEIGACPSDTAVWMHQYPNNDIIAEYPYADSLGIRTIAESFDNQGAISGTENITAPVPPARVFTQSNTRFFVGLREEHLGSSVVNAVRPPDSVTVRYKLAQQAASTEVLLQGLPGVPNAIIGTVDLPPGTTQDFAHAINDACLRSSNQDVCTVRVELLSTMGGVFTIEETATYVNSSFDNATQPCTPNWTLGAWDACTGGLQYRVVNDTNGCNNNDTKPTENQSCTVPPGCASSWICGDWSTCTAGTQTRTCTDDNACATPNPANPNAVALTCTKGGNGCTGDDCPSDTTWWWYVGGGAALLAFIFIKKPFDRRKGRRRRR